MPHEHEVGSVEEQERLDARTPPPFRAIATRVEIACGRDWSFMVWRTAEGCMAYALASSGGSSRSLVRFPRLPDDPSRYIVGALGKDVAGGDGLGVVAGIVVPEVARVEVEFDDGRVEFADTAAMPAELDTDLRTFLIRTRVNVRRPVRPGGPTTPIRAYTSLSSDGALLERLEVPGKSPPPGA